MCEAYRHMSARKLAVRCRKNGNEGEGPFLVRLLLLLEAQNLCLSVSAQLRQALLSDVGESGLLREQTLHNPQMLVEDPHMTRSHWKRRATRNGISGIGGSKREERKSLCDCVTLKPSNAVAMRQS